MKNKGFLTSKFHSREPGDDAKAGKSRESNRAIVMRRRREAIQGPPAAALRSPNCFVPSLRSASVAMTVHRDRKTRERKRSAPHVDPADPPPIA
jgi:hypothetical protein